MDDRAFLGVGLRLEHERMDVPSILLWSSNRIRLERALRASLLGQTTETPRGIDAQPGFFRAAAVHWRSFALAWAFPVFFFCGARIADAAGYGEAFFLLTAAPFFWSFFRATRPVREGLLAYGPYVFWGMVVPFLIGGAVAFLQLLE